MSQVIDRTVGANPSGFDMRTELNNVIAALESDNSGASEPLNTVAYMKWLDTSDTTYYYYKERNHDNTAWVTLFRYTVATKIMEAVSNGVVLSQTDIASEIHASSSKTTPVDADEIGLIDSASTFTLKKLTWSNLKATLKTYFDTLYVALSGNQTISGIKTFASFPISPSLEPTTDYQFSNKKYVDDLIKKPCFSAYRTTSNQSITTSTFTKVQLNAEEFDTDNAFDSTTNYRFQPLVAGKYQINCSASIQATSMTGAGIAIYKNGTLFKYLNFIRISTSNDVDVTGSAIVDLNGSTDYIEMYAYIIGTTPVINQGSPYTFMSGHFIRS